MSRYFNPPQVQASPRRQLGQFSPPANVQPTAQPRFGAGGPTAPGAPSIPTMPNPISGGGPALAGLGQSRAAFDPSRPGRPGAGNLHYTPPMSAPPQQEPVPMPGAPAPVPAPIAPDVGMGQVQLSPEQQQQIQQAISALMARGGQGNLLRGGGGALPQPLPIQPAPMPIRPQPLGAGRRGPVDLMFGASGARPY